MSSDASSTEELSSDSRTMEPGAEGGEISAEIVLVPKVSVELSTSVIREPIGEEEGAGGEIEMFETKVWVSVGVVVSGKEEDEEEEGMMSKEGVSKEGGERTRSSSKEVGLGAEGFRRWNVSMM